MQLARGRSLQIAHKDHLLARLQQLLLLRIHRTDIRYLRSLRIHASLGAINSVRKRLSDGLIGKLNILQRQLAGVLHHEGNRQILIRRRRLMRSILGLRIIQRLSISNRSNIRLRTDVLLQLNRRRLRLRGLRMSRILIRRHRRNITRLVRILRARGHTLGLSDVLMLLTTLGQDQL
ncbi:hypothetical protein MHT86_06100, partial [Corynebacterium mastitidis]|uniref:hypothetical protein n=1 Tax=Corynebacterium mastitidis TaxID=161890 RepID=UPI001F138005